MKYIKKFFSLFARKPQRKLGVALQRDDIHNLFAQKGRTVTLTQFYIGTIDREYLIDSVDPELTVAILERFSQEQLWQVVREVLEARALVRQHIR